MSGLIYPKLSYKLIGIIFEIYNELGFGYQEKHYQRAFKKELERNNLKYRQELPVNLVFNNEKIGKYSLDFLVEDQVIVELKVAKDFYPKYIKQVLGYLKTTGKRLGILALFTPDGLRYKRLVN
jgi:GxxExxY protein